MSPANTAVNALAREKSANRQIAEQLAKRAAGENAKLINAQVDAARGRLAGANSILRRRHINLPRLASVLGGWLKPAKPSEQQSGRKSWSVQKTIHLEPD